ncbi:MAG: lytic transglycosylase domain-containing protein [Muribaculaceae bacterium]|nr:lytic transglycosylase domain-containing protein [Muribaculaceae bacterium]
MNKHIILATALALTSISCTSAPSASQGEAARQQQAPDHTYAVPQVPDTVHLCGQTVNLDRADMWERYDRELSSVAFGHGSTTLMIKRANKYFPVLAPILEANGVPLDLLYLACAESTLNPRAYSSAKAAGFWQFLASTGQQYGLEVNDEVDERYHVEKATAAACKYLKQAYRKYGDWATAMASYNAGQGRISSELDKQGVDSSFDLYLVDETSRYVFRIMAIKAVMEHPSDYGFVLTADQLYQPVAYKEVEVSGPVADWPAWAQEHGITYSELREANPWIRAKKLTNKQGKTYTVKVPTSDGLSRSRQQKQVYNPAWVK